MLAELIDTDRPQVMAARVAWDRLAAMSSADAASPRLRHLVPAGDGPASADGSGSTELAGLLAAPPADAPRLTQEYLQSRIGLVLGSGSATIDPDRPLTDLGLDSLMAVELLATLKSELGVEVAVVQLLQGVTLADLAALVLTELEPRRAATPAAELPAAVEEPSVAAKEPAEKVAVDGNGRRPTLQPAPEQPASEPAQPHTRIREHWTPGQRLARGIVGLGVRMAARVEVEGLEHVPSSGAFILAGNHLSMSDVPVGWTHMERSIIPLVSHDLRQTRWLRWVLSGIGHAVYIRRGEGDEDALTRGLAVLRAGGAILIAPEGKRSPGGLRRGNTGRRLSRHSGGGARRSRCRLGTGGLHEQLAATATRTGSAPLRAAARLPGRPADQPGTAGAQRADHARNRKDASARVPRGLRRHGRRGRRGGNFRRSHGAAGHGRRHRAAVGANSSRKSRAMCAGA